ncbi:hypothetical protein GGI43DRAFT_422180 [Trichoderma evansii]
MKVDNLYNSYKRDTELLVEWIIKTSNAIIKKYNIVLLLELIAKHRPSIQSTTYHLFYPSEELERDNSTHKYFIDTLTSAFEVLGGEKWLSKEQEKRTHNDREEESDTNTFAFTNKFSMLDLESDPENINAFDANNEESDKESTPPQKNQKSRKGRKRGKGKKAQHDRRSSQSDGRALDDTPLKRYRIVEDNNMTMYAMAVFALTRDMIQLRSFLQDIWRKVAYKNLNSAVAATVSNIAVAMIRQSEATIFVDFPGYESFEMVKQTITRGDVERAVTEFQFALHRIKIKNSSETTETLLDIKELFFIHTYHDLVDFITDYQKTRSGKPTKRMLAQIDNWNPNLDLQKATEEERIKWRRSYTINWLYDLVNITACVAIHGKNAKSENYAFEQMDWSDQGPLKSYRRMFGLINFAARVTTLAMQKHGTDFRHRIPPHLVFHLQCIMDAWTVSRGWAISGVKGHILSEPAKGYFGAIGILKMCYMRLKNDIKGLEHTKYCIRILEKLGSELLDALGTCKIFHNLSASLPSSHSPFFCGAGLAEGLKLLYRSFMTLWEGIREPILVLHLHNMLVQRGYFKQAPPTGDYVEAFRSQLGKIYSRKAVIQEKSNRPVKSAHARDFLNLTILHLFKQKSVLLMYGSADWDPDRVPDSDIDPKSALGIIRLSQTKRVRDPVTSVWRLEETELVKRTRSEGLDESLIICFDSVFDMLGDERQAQIAQMTLCAPDCSSTQLPKLHDTNTTSKREESSIKATRYEMTAERMLTMLYNDVHDDIYGGHLPPLSSFGYLWITIQMLLYFKELESESQNSSSSVESGGKCYTQSDKRLFVTLRALGGKDKELLKSMAKVFERWEGRFFDYMYWGAEDDEAETTHGSVVEDGSPDCCVM